jgi:hypothetical protein
MKAQFFIISSVIMVYVIIATFQYLSSFGDINLSKIGEMQELSYVSQVKDALNQVVVTSNASSGCDRLDGDLNFTENFLKRELITKGIILTVSHRITNCPSSAQVHVNFSIKNSQTYAFTEFDSVPQPQVTCPDGVCKSGETCLADNTACEPAVCYASTCSSGCTAPAAIGAGLTDTAGSNQCHDNVGCTPSPGYSCECDGLGNCIDSFITSPNLVAYWKFDESSGIIASDSSGNGKTGTLYNGPVWSNLGKVGNALSFDGVNDYVEILHPTGNLVGPLTFAAWIYPRGDGILINKENSWEVAVIGGSIQWAFNNADPGWVWKSTGYSPSLNQWTHVAVVYDILANQVISYVNGAPISNIPISGSITTTTENLRIGGRTATSQYFNGMIDEVKVWNRTLSASEIQAEST